ncbi:hypothetical protein LCGC14_2345590 [marine sediment metagenome]|uniref:DUF1059 domain-containing protein n=1 Tax=marine sediment metagenome TaxID=412755 RepID=A0A0F9ENF1_9ZZZZ
MATVKVVYNCGCGFKTENGGEAVLHADADKHQMTIAGSVKPEK